MGGRLHLNQKLYIQTELIKKWGHVECSNQNFIIQNRDTHFPDELLDSSSDNSSLSVSACLRARSAVANIWRDREAGTKTVIETGGQGRRQEGRHRQKEAGGQTDSIFVSKYK